MSEFKQGEIVLVDDIDIQRRATVFVHQNKRVALKYNDNSKRHIYHERKVYKLGSE